MRQQRTPGSPGVRCSVTGQALLGVTTTGAPATTTQPTRARLDRPVLVSNAVSGALWLLLVAALWSDQFGSWVLFGMGAVYAAAGSVFLAAVYACEVLTMGQEALAWVTPWLVAVALWTLLLAAFDFENSVSSWLLALFAGLCIGTPCYLAWQIVALAVRQLVGWLSSTAPRGP
jgi:hypothetical protein